MDVMKLAASDSLPATSSPEVPAEKLRQQFQGAAAAKPAETETPPKWEENETRFELE